MSKAWKEGQEREVKLPEAKVDIFKIWVQWLYTGKIFLTKEDDQKETGANYTSDEWPRWQECYILGDFLRDHDFKDACIDVCIEAISSTRKLPKALPEVVYAHSPDGSAHRKLAIETFVECAFRSDFEWYTEGLSEAFMRDVVLYIAPRLAEGLKQRSITEYLESVDICKYHGHGSERSCYRTKPAFRL